MLKLPLVTFVVTSFNYEKYILKTLKSIKNQTYKNFEIIVVDDNSTDKSTEIVEQFIADNQDLKITLFKQDKNQGQFAAMLKGLKEANGQFISFIDSDDILLPEYAKSHINVHLKTSIAFTSCQIAEIGENDELHTLASISSPHCENLDELFASETPNFKILKHKCFGGWYWSPNSSAMFRKASIEILLNYKNTNKWKICPDKFLFNFAHLIGGSAIIYTPLIGYRRHSNNAGNCSLVTGNKRLHSDYITKINIKNNLKIRPETIKFLWQERKTLGKRTTLRLILKIFF
jgi:glycosyltransferase involved in cell wall biosynthesis